MTVGGEGRMWRRGCKKRGFLVFFSLFFTMHYDDCVSILRGNVARGLDFLVQAFVWSVVYLGVN